MLVDAKRAPAWNACNVKCKCTENALPHGPHGHTKSRGERHEKQASVAWASACRPRALVAGPLRLAVQEQRLLVLREVGPRRRPARRLEEQRLLEGDHVRHRRYGADRCAADRGAG